MKALDLSGMRIGMLMILERVQKGDGVGRWKCKCDCGSVVVKTASNLKRGHTTSCGCKRLRQTHGHTSHGRVSALYRTWSSMIQRCTNQLCPGYENYGGRGISVCDRWKNFSEFMNDMGERPQ